jgi:catechol 2,3-dioxygenase-like lactoylglutathione lyase family enzyme
MIQRSILAVFCFVVVMLAQAQMKAQLAAPGTSGVVMGHVHLTAKDAAAGKTFWTALGGIAVQNGTLQLIQFPGTFVMLRQGQPTGGSVGSTVDHLTFRVANLPRSIERWSKEAGIVVSPDGSIETPDGIRIRLLNDGSADGPPSLGAIIIVTIAPQEVQAWYVKQFGATPGKPGPTMTATLPGVTLEFGKADAAPASTRGRALDHIGFEVKNLEEFCKKLEAAGLKLDRPFTRLPNSSTAIAFLTDPWGTYIELTENLAPPK